MSRLVDAAAPARPADLTARLTSSPHADALDAALPRPAPSDPRLAALAEESLVAAASAIDAPVGRASLAAAVRTGLRRLAEAHPGKLVEVRVPPFAAVQIGVPGQAAAHTRGTPPNVVELDAATWFALASGRLAFADAVAARRVRASGVHADITGQLRSLA